MIDVDPFGALSGLNTKREGYPQQTNFRARQPHSLLRRDFAYEISGGFGNFHSFGLVMNPGDACVTPTIIPSAWA
jgi:hypothetical protein